MLITLMTTLLSMAPSLLQLFIKDKQTRDKALKDFYEAVQAHANDGLLSVRARQDAQRQFDDLAEAARARDEAEGRS